METIIETFNGVISDFITQLADICPDSTIAANKSTILSIMKMKPSTIVDIFVLYVLKYKPQIDSGDESFFMNNTFDSELGGDQDKVNKMFEFKNIWNILTEENKEIVKQFMQCLCQLAQEHFLATHS